jgi:Glycosyltransferase sugar-binding region containing DXD motif
MIYEKTLQFAPYLREHKSPRLRRESSRQFDARITQFLGRAGTAALPQINCFYEVLSDSADNRGLIAATTSMRAAGHPVRVWSYLPEKLDFLKPYGIEVLSASEVVPLGIFQRVLAGSEIRYFSDLFRYAVLYEHGGLWMDTDVILIRSFPFRGDFFFNLQWHDGAVCGNVAFAKPLSRHLRYLYELALDRFVRAPRSFAAIGPELLSDYIGSPIGSELQDWVFSPMLFNPIDWTEIELFKHPISGLSDYLSDERTFGIHLWNAVTHSAPRDNASLISLLSDPLQRLPKLTTLADRFETDKNRHTGNHHFYSRAYDRLLSSRRFSLCSLMEIGLCVPSGGKQIITPSVDLWLSYFPFCRVIGLDLVDFSHLNNERFTSFVCDQSKPSDLQAVAERIEAGSIDVIIDDGSHASYDQQLTLRAFFPLVRENGWYFIEDLDWQPTNEDRGKITGTKRLLQEIQYYGGVKSIDALQIGQLAPQFAEILFFDSHFELAKANHLGGLVAIRKSGTSGLN